MSARQSDLTSKQYGYDLVVGVTQASVNATMEEWLSGLDAKPFIMGYKYNPKASDPKNPYYPIDNWSDFVKELGFDPFTLPDNTPESDPRMVALMGQYFAFAFQAEIGMPDFPPESIPPVVSFDKQGSYVTYNMVNKLFQVVGLVAPPYGPRYWLNANQADGSEVWDFQFTVDLDLQEGDLNNHFHSLPPATQETIKNLGQDMFSVQQLYLDLNTAALSNSYTIRGLDPASTIYQMLCSVFFAAYFKDLAKDGGVMLGFAVQASKPFPESVSLIPTDLNFEISAYTSAGKPTTDYDAYTLNYLVMADGHAMPAPVPFTWNWVDKSEVGKDAGTMAVNRNAFRDFLSTKLSCELSRLAMKPDCGFSVNLVKATVNTSFAQDAAPQSFQCVGAGETLLTSQYASSDSSSDTFVPNWGNWGIDYTAACDVSVSGNTITVAAKVNAHCHLNVDGGVTDGNWASYKITTEYTIGVTPQGALFVTSNDPQVQDVSEKPDPGWWSELISLGTIDNCVESIQSYLQPLLKGFGTGFAQDIAMMLNGSAGWTFPGGMTFLFSNASFSDYQDLVAELVYQKPQG